MKPSVRPAAPLSAHRPRLRRSTDAGRYIGATRNGCRNPSKAFGPVQSDEFPAWSAAHLPVLATAARSGNETTKNKDHDQAAQAVAKDRSLHPLSAGRAVAR